MPKQKIILFGKLPPPFIGPAIATKIILSSNLKNEFELIHLDTSDHRDINTLGVIDFWNIYLAFKHYCTLYIIIIPILNVFLLEVGEIIIQKTSLSYS